MDTVTSADGTKIAFERTGGGPPVILVGGAFNDRTTVAGLAGALNPEYSGIAYDRRGRGDSTDGDEYTIEREVEDLAALIEHVGGRASVFGHSSGAILSLEAAQRGLPIDKLAVYEPPFIVGGRELPGDDLTERLRACAEEDRREDAVMLFLTEGVGVPKEQVEGMKSSPMWGWFTGLAHTLYYDTTLCGLGNRLPDWLARIAVPTLAIGGGTTDEWMRLSAKAVADAIPDGRYVVLEGHDHGVLSQPEALKPMLAEFFG
ncbi:alpha/beta fold hydrolase [Amycolatopsis sp. NPDC059657]|uniref:alpha/beta fold hydrolase n=1 Tax=Amycolatopsis sp. NPDC059657 TaxID=3346899 RepID=UPI00366FE47F